ncbi:hypothetical protein [Aureliella helgolandensis]|uniref:Uncharacterized protein n=1 Tax=Aureliella helgolandensis TaxID=2527968 RepID=A0A518GAF2_9BACT|nr:hypothetical protein [Aureliella helgolandensis]QDV25564.1 hypothetical protein Q31a_38900 [Aureliella helgolandensis]
MSNAGNSSDPNSSANDGSFSIRKSSPDLLREVLESTLTRGEGGLAPEELLALQEIARAHGDSQLDMLQITELLVAGLLSTRFPGLANRETNQLMCQRIADSLCGDPVSMQRLKTMWNQLRESVS